MLCELFPGDEGLALPSPSHSATLREAGVQVANGTSPGIGVTWQILLMKKAFLFFYIFELIALPPPG